MVEKGTAKQKPKRYITKDSLLNLLSVVYQSGAQEHCMPSGIYLGEKGHWISTAITKMNKTVVSLIFTHWPAPPHQRRDCSTQSKDPSQCAASYSMVGLEAEVTKWLADNQPSFKSYYSKRPEAHHTWTKDKRQKSRTLMGKSKCYSS